VRYKPVEYGDSPYPVWAEVIGWMMTLASNIPIVVVAAAVLFKAPGTTLRQVRNVCNYSLSSAAVAVLLSK